MNFKMKHVMQATKLKSKKLKSGLLFCKPLFFLLLFTLIIPAKILAQQTISWGVYQDFIYNGGSNYYALTGDGDPTAISLEGKNVDTAGTLFIQFTVTELNSSNYDVGFAVSNNYVTDSVEYGARIQGSTLKYVVNGTTGTSATVVNGDVVKVELSPTSLILRVNGSIRTTTTVNVHGEFYMHLLSRVTTGTTKIGSITSSYHVDARAIDLFTSYQIEHDLRDNIITASGGFPGTFIAYNYIPENGSGWLQQQLNNASGFGYKLGFADATSEQLKFFVDVNSDQSIDVYNIFADEYSPVLDDFEYKDGDYLLIELTPQNCYFKLNGDTIYSTSLDSIKPFAVSGEIYDDGNNPSIENLVTNIPNTASNIVWSSLDKMDFSNLTSELSRQDTVTGTTAGISYSLGSITEPEEGYFDFKISGSSATSSLIGLADELYTNSTDMDYYFKFYVSSSTPTYKCYYKNQELASGTYAPGIDRFKLFKTNGQILFIKNNATVHTRTIDDVFAEFHVQAFVRNSDHRIKDLKLLKWFDQVSNSKWDVKFCSPDNNTHWVENRSFDLNGNLVSRGKVYADYMGRTLQVQGKTFSDNNVLAYQPLYDDLGRPIASTLTAPMYKDYFCYDPLFVSNNSNTKYTYNDFDKPITNSNLSGERNTPGVVGENVKGQLGWYYSNNNTEEPFVASDDLPYSRVEYYPDPLGRIKRSGGVGIPLKMGSGKEGKVFHLSTGGELKYVYNADISQHKKTIVVDQEGKVYVTFTNGMGQALATCRSDISTTCTAQEVTSVIHHDQQNFVDVHIPHSKKVGKLFLPVANNLYNDSYGAGVYTSTELNDKATAINQAACACTTSVTCSTSDADVIYTFLDLNTYKEMTSPGDYSINTSTGEVTFSGTYASGSAPVFIRISRTFTPCYLAKIAYTQQRRNAYEHPADLAVKYELDYSQWALNFYDKANQLVKTVPPEGVDCNFDPNIYMMYSTPAHQEYATTNPANTTLGSLGGNPTAVTAWYATSSQAPSNHYNVTYLNNNSSASSPNHFDAPAAYGTVPFTQKVKLYLFARPNGTNINDYNENYAPSPCHYYTSHENDYDPPFTNVDDWVKNTNNSPLIQIRKGPGDNPGQDLDGLILVGRDVTEQDEKALYGTRSFEDDMMGLVLQEITGGAPSAAYTNTDETVGTGDPITPVDPCAGKPNYELVRFRIYAELRAEHSSTTIAFPLSSSFFEAAFHVTCACETKWTFSNTVSAELDIDENGKILTSLGLVDYEDLENIRIHISSVKASTDGGANYEPFNPNDYTAPGYHNELMHEWYRFLYLKTEIVHFKYPLNNIQDHQMAEVFKYDNEGQLIESWTPDEGKTEYKYDTEGKVRFTQNEKQRVSSGGSSHTYSFVNYDKSARPTVTGVYTGATSFSGISANQINYKAGHEFPLTGITEVSRFFYDTKPTTYPSGYPTGSYTQSSINLMGKLVKMENDHAISWFNYNNYGMVTQAVTQFTTLTAQFKTLDYEYDITKGQLTKTKMQNGISGEEFYHQYSYDADGRLAEVRANTTNVFSNTSTIIETYKYYDHGALKRVEKGGNSMLQGIDYVYTVQGWLKSINDPTLTARDPGRDGWANATYTELGGQSIPGTNASFKRDIFGTTIDYFTDDYKRKSTYIEPNNTVNSDCKDYFDGKIKGVRWSMRTTTLTVSDQDFTDLEQVSYTYLYDDFNRLKQAKWGKIIGTDYGTINNTAGTGGSPLSITYDAWDSYKEYDITYDRNGNLLTLKRNKLGSGAVATMDNLTYSYKTQTNPYTSATEKTNRMHKVEDGIGGHSAGDDFASGQVNDSYVYDQLGRVTECINTVNTNDAYKITYNSSGYITEVKDGSNVTLVKYGYDAGGQRVWKEVYSSGVLSHTMYYHRDAGGQVVGTYKYTGSALSPSDITITGAGRIGVLDVDGTPSTKRTNYLDNIHYELTDHLGNIRAVFKRGASNAVVLESVADYYAFGAPIAGRNIQSTSPLYQFTTQGQQTDTELENKGFVEFELRFLETRLGRWLSPDPYAQHWSPYVSMGNNPVSRVDPDGGWDGPQTTVNNEPPAGGPVTEPINDWWNDSEWQHAWWSEWSTGNKPMNITEWGENYIRGTGDNTPETPVSYRDQVSDGEINVNVQQDYGSGNVNFSPDGVRIGGPPKHGKKEIIPTKKWMWPTHKNNSGSDLITNINSLTDEGFTYDPDNTINRMINYVNDPNGPYEKYEKNHPTSNHSDVTKDKIKRRKHITSVYYLRITGLKAGDVVTINVIGGGGGSSKRVNKKYGNGYKMKSRGFVKLRIDMIENSEDPSSDVTEIRYTINTKKNQNGNNDGHVVNVTERHIEKAWIPGLYQPKYRYKQYRPHGRKKTITH